MTLRVRRRWHYHALRALTMMVYPSLIVGVAMAAFYPETLTHFLRLRVFCGLAGMFLILRPKVEHVPSLQGARAPAERPGGDGRAFRHVIKLVDTTIEPIPGSDNPRPTLR